MFSLLVEFFKTNVFDTLRVFHDKLSVFGSMEQITDVPKDVYNLDGTLILWVLYHIIIINMKNYLLSKFSSWVESDLYSFKKWVIKHIWDFQRLFLLFQLEINLAGSCYEEFVFHVPKISSYIIFLS